MKQRGATVRIVLGTLVAVLVGAAAAALVTTAHAQILGPGVRLDKLRFKIIGDEPILLPNEQNVSPDMKMILLMDRQSRHCYFVVLAGAAASMTGPEVCPQ